ncbi:alcohol dehydrogenase catalytic domain-containing protein [Nonomuraea sp. AD125B]|uniref:alcohol dehydrogenase catalytic domain-containing protein n=1 Tax=Nonomuraea sp. AD125B TaxID=3242897 RepID=UPI003528BECF
MRAVVIRTFGGPEVLQIADVPMPVAGEGQVRIRVEAATVNPVDLATRSGALTEAGLLPGRDVIGIGWDVAGTVEETGPGVTGLRRGDRVIGLSDRLDVPLGAQAEHVVLDAGRGRRRAGGRLIRTSRHTPPERPHRRPGARRARPGSRADAAGDRGGRRRRRLRGPAGRSARAPGDRGRRCR